jgi:hypothetical protein
MTNTYKNSKTNTIVFTLNRNLLINNRTTIYLDKIQELENELLYANYFQNIIDENNTDNLEWIIYDINENSGFNKEKMLILNSYIPYCLYRQNPKVKFIFLTSGYVFGNENWNQSTEIDRHSPIDFYGKTISVGEIYSERVWTFRYELFNDINIKFNNEKTYYGSIDKKYTYITNLSLNLLINGFIQNYYEIKNGVYHLIPKDEQTEYEIFHYIAWRNNQSPYIERSSSVIPINHTLKTIKRKELEKLWGYANYESLPSFRELFENKELIEE